MKTRDKKDNEADKESMYKSIQDTGDCRAHLSQQEIVSNGLWQVMHTTGNEHQVCANQSFF